MDVVIGEEILRDPELGRIRPHPCKGGLHRFLHHLTDLPGHGEGAFALHTIGFDEQNIATGRSPGQTDGHTCPLRALGDFAFGTNLDAPKKLLHHLFGDDQRLGFSFRQAARLLAANGADIALQVTNPGFMRVVTNNVADRFFGELDLFLGNAVFLDLARY